MRPPRTGRRSLRRTLRRPSGSPLNCLFGEGGNLCIPARKLLRPSGKWKTATVSPGTGGIGNRLQRAERKELLPPCSSLNADEYPVWPVIDNPEELTLPSSELLDIIERTLYAAGESGHEICVKRSALPLQARRRPVRRGNGRPQAGADRERGRQIFKDDRAGRTKAHHLPEDRRRAEEVPAERFVGGRDAPSVSTTCSFGCAKDLVFPGPAHRGDLSELRTGHSPELRRQDPHG
ncbi:MAG: hypothetical protein MZU79_03195 [Anaerotruncus sp.]|nr:hypothetical protein [Anaerotruncus sp.]